MRKVCGGKAREGREDSEGMEESEIEMIGEDRGVTWKDMTVD